MLGPDRLGVLSKHGYSGRKGSTFQVAMETRVEDYIHLFLSILMQSVCLPVSIDLMGAALDSSASTGDIDGTSTMDRPRILERECLPLSPGCMEPTSTGDSFDSFCFEVLGMALSGQGHHLQRGSRRTTRIIHGSGFHPFPTRDLSSASVLESIFSKKSQCQRDGIGRRGENLRFLCKV